MLRLYDNLSSGNGYKCRLLLHKLGIPYERIELDIDRAETRTPEFLARNPNGRIPTLQLEDGSHLPESNAIVWYLAEGTPYLPDDREGRARVLQWMFFEQYSHEPNIATVRFWITHHVEMTEERKLGLVTKRRLGHDALGVMDGHLAERRFFVGDRFSVADIALYAYTHVAEEGGFDLSGYPAVRAWMERVAAEGPHIPITQG
ncbi:glutathione S-transferase family protein [Azospirillum argentinense]|uniref:Glutathione S-transferase family protein n=1 Tax=Azospirillum argentinense TaxID=2970906 RepID=A0A5B0KPG8_9PROT|nr:glutathione S-transferase family protein [Azospirillum argentinense]KAA1053480.1 Glutathione S-transferase [Azospirillum argentinense]